MNENTDIGVFQSPSLFSMIRHVYNCVQLKRKEKGVMGTIGFNGKVQESTPMHGKTHNLQMVPSSKQEAT
jgi:hypothetical protein